jgi:anthranilate synthase/aminodeoxychorismate synthase-like glutamine amidotransferase
VKRNDEITIDEVRKLSPQKIIISPGPGRPEDAGISVELVKQFYRTIPILGVCLGHQAIALAFGGKIIKAPKVMHGKTSQISHDGKGVFQGLPNPFVATRYHSLVVDPTNLSPSIVVSAHTFHASRFTNDAIIMGIRHKDYPVEGVQFHPESVLTEVGKDLIRNFVEGRR